MVPFESIGDPCEFYVIVNKERHEVGLPRSRARGCGTSLVEQRFAGIGESENVPGRLENG